ncbi:GNAT family protein [Actinokineospora auranticolor]|uniref:RimJ/RimL family protein N-acetyltransferase n=1 Tax=Actinokineospora auranticolor TaxID=155976 RepID=A0A2S6GYF4_9PSEU|nr:GNAT family protein [Actinokineospora auranticolor]PPK70254.1 RimJ/RimL family protein N-acetyltransferase [Actinokineospora auranticolor]
MSLTGTLVRLRALEPDDADLIWHWDQDEGSMRWLVTSYPESRQAIRKRIEERVNGYERVVFGIEELADGRLVGITALRDTNPENGRGTLDLYLGSTEDQGKGYGTDALRVLCRFAFNDMRLHAIGLTVVAENESARHVYRKVGFVEEGRTRETFRRDGELHDEVIMSLLAREFTGR